jgi:hypothetical protein
MSGDMSATQIINVWRSFHSVELTPLQMDKLEAAVLLIAEGSYKAGIVQGRKEWEKARKPNGNPET